MYTYFYYENTISNTEMTTTTATAAPITQYRAFLFTSSFGLTFIVAGLRLGALILIQPFYIFFCPQ